MTKGYIPQELIDEIAARTDIVSIISEYMPLKKKGMNYQGLCPFHNEKTPSFSVSANKQIFHCFGCGVGGNVFSFLMQIEHLTFIEAVEKLAKRAGIALPKKELTPAQQKIIQKRERSRQINEVTAKFYHKVLVDSKWGKPYLDYLYKRGISQETIERFQLGACLPGWDGLYQFLAKRGVQADEMIELGLVSARSNGSGYYDRFRERVMFPIRDEKGRHIAFGGRIIDSEKSPQKYINSSDTPIFNKGRHLYGLDLAKTAIRAKDRAIIVEGYMDVICCAQYGVENVVASLGTAFTSDQGRLLMRNTYQIGIAYDGDAAGSKATLRCLEILDDLGAQTRVISLPDGLDPDDFLRKHGVSAFEQQISKSQESIAYKIDKILGNINTDGIMGKSKAIEQILPDLVKISSPVTREMAIKLVNQRIGVSEDAIVSEMKKYTQNKERNLEYKYHMVEGESTHQSLYDEGAKKEAQLIKLVFEHNEWIASVEEAGGQELFQGKLKELYLEIKKAYEAKNVVKSTDIPMEMSSLLATVLMEDLVTNHLEKTVADYINKLKLAKLENDYRLLQQRITEAEKMGATEEMLKLLQELELVRQKKKVVDALRRGINNG